ncbi:MAG: hypothetical protein ACOX8Q_02135, partial [Christensenellales bacterium]
MKKRNSDNDAVKEPTRVNSKSKFTSEQSNTDLIKETSDNTALSKKKQRELEKQQIKDIRALNEKYRQDSFEQKQSRKAALFLLSKEERKAFLLSEKEEKLKKKQHANT